MQSRVDETSTNGARDEPAVATSAPCPAACLPQSTSASGYRYGEEEVRCSRLWLLITRKGRVIIRAGQGRHEFADTVDRDNNDPYQVFEHAWLSPLALSHSSVVQTNMSRHVPSQSRYTQQQQQQQGSSNSRIAGGSSSSRASGLPQPQQSSAGHRARFADTTVQDGGDDDDDGEEEDNIETTTTTTRRHEPNRGVRLTALQQLVKDKHAEWEGFVEMYKHTEQLDAFLKQTADRTDLLRDGGASEWHHERARERE